MVLRGCRALRVFRFYHAFMISSGRLVMLPSCRLPFCGPVVLACMCGVISSRLCHEVFGRKPTEPACPLPLVPWQLRWTSSVR